jgi:hypothetical protein
MERRPVRARVIVKDRDRFLWDLDLVEVHRHGEGPMKGLRNISRAQEHTLHEYAHAITVNLALAPYERGHRMSLVIKSAITKRAHVQENEVRTIAAELPVLHALQAVEDEQEWLMHVEQQTGVPGLQARVLTKTRGRRYRLAEQDAQRIIARIRAHARDRRLMRDHAGKSQGGAGVGR